jgi:hypothetical protein
MAIDQAAIQRQVIEAHSHEIKTTEDAIKVSVLVGEAIDAAYDQPLAHTKRIVRSDSDFTDGLCSGYLTYFHEYQGKLLLDTDIARLLRECLTDQRYSDLFNAGWVVSFVEAVIEDRDLFAG